jgi:endoglucanase
MVTNVFKEYVSIIPIGDISPESLHNEQLAFFTNDRKRISKIISKGVTFQDIKVAGLHCKTGDVGSFLKRFEIKNNTVVSPGLDNKVGCLVLILLINTLKSIELNNRYVFCFSDREETGFNGITSALNIYKPDFCIDIDSAYALPLNGLSTKNWFVPTSGKGPAIQLIGNGFIICAETRKTVESVAYLNNIPFQYEIPDGLNGGTQAKIMIQSGYTTLQINIPVGEQHTAKSFVSTFDILQTFHLIKNLLYTDETASILTF